MGLKAGQAFQPIRVAVCGRKNAPPLFETMVVLGREVCLERIRQAESLSKHFNCLVSTAFPRGSQQQESNL